MSNEKNCQITLYLDTPKLFLRPGLDKEYGSLVDGGIKDSTWLTGHAFIGLTDEKGKEQKWGFGPVGFDDDLIKYTTGCPSYFKDESGTHYNEAVVYPVTRRQYDAAAKKVEELKKNHGEYKLFSRNCSTTASAILRAAGIKAPDVPTGLMPHGLTIKKRLMMAARKIQIGLIKAKNKIAKLFGGKLIPTTKILDALRNKPIPIPIREGMKANAAKQPINPTAILTAMLDKKAKAK